MTTRIKKSSKATGYTLKILTIIFFILAAIKMLIYSITFAIPLSFIGLMLALGYRSAAKRYNAKLRVYVSQGGKI